MLNRPIKRPKRSHLWQKEPTGFHVEPHWCSRRLFDPEMFAGEIWDCACGIGRVADGAYASGYNVVGTDLVDRGYPHFDGRLDFLLCDRALAENVVCNPPFDLVWQFVTHALKLATGKVAMMMLTRRLNAAHWLITMPLKRIYLLSPACRRAPSSSPTRSRRAASRTSCGWSSTTSTGDDRSCIGSIATESNRNGCIAGG